VVMCGISVRLTRWKRKHQAEPRCSQLFRHWSDGNGSKLTIADV
jgi:hypothetical protein